MKDDRLHSDLSRRCWFKSFMALAAAEGMTACSAGTPRLEANEDGSAAHATGVSAANDPWRQLALMRFAKVQTQLVYAAAKLGIADLLKDGQRSVEELAQATGSHTPSLYRLLRALASLQVFTETQPRHFGLTPVAELLQTDHPRSQRNSTIFSGSEWVCRPHFNMLHSVRTGETAFRYTFGMGAWEYRLDFEMTAGEISEHVTVMGQSTIMDTDTAEVAAVIEEKTILDLPLRGRDLVKLAYLTTGGTQERQEVGYTDLQAYGGGYPSFNGLYNHSNQITLDGSNNMGYISQRPAVQPTPETVQEFKVITNNYSAESGRVGGAVISMLSKSGSNEYHGHGWYYFRDESLDGAGFFANKVGSEKLPVNYEIFGGSVGGPILRDRTFFHAHYERFMDDFERIDFLTVPTTALIGGDFSGRRQRADSPPLQPVRCGGWTAPALRQQPDCPEQDGPGVPEADGPASTAGAQRHGSDGSELQLPQHPG